MGKFEKQGNGVNYHLTLLLRRHRPHHQLINRHTNTHTVRH